MNKPSFARALRIAFDSVDDMMYVLRHDDEKARALRAQARKRMAGMAADTRLAFDRFLEPLRQTARKRMAAAGLATDNAMEEPMMFDMAPLKEFLEARGISGDSWDEFVSMLPKSMTGDMSDEEAAEISAAHGHTDLGRPEDRARDDNKHESEIGQQPARQRVLERSEKRYAPEHSAQNREADRREARNSIQRDSIPRPGTKGGMGGRFSGAHDADLDAVHALLDARPASAFAPPMRERSTGPANLGLDSNAKRAAFLKRLDKRIGA